MKCITCKQLDLQSNETMSRLGYGKCKLETVKWHYVSFRFERQCKTHAEVEEDVKFKRTTCSERL